MLTRNNSINVLWIVPLCIAWLQSSHFAPWVSFHSETIAFFAFAMLFAVVLKQSRSIKSLEIPFSAVVILLLAAIVFAQKVAGLIDYTGDATVIALYLVAMAAAVIAGRHSGVGDKASYMAWGILLSGTMCVVIAALQSMHFGDQYTLINPMPSWRRPGANLAQPNHLGTLLLWAIVSAMYLHTAQKFSKTLTCLICTILLAGLAMTESRTALLGVFAIAAWSGIHYFQGSRSVRCTKAFGIVTVGMGAFMLWPVFIVGFQEGGLAGSGGGINSTTGDRSVVWPQLFAAIAERPWLGWGARGVSVAHNAVLDQYSRGAPFTYAHNIFLDIAIGFGIPIALLIMSLVLVWAARQIMSVRNATDWYAVALLIPFGLHSMLEFPFAYAYFLLPAGFAIGLLDADWSRVRGLFVPRHVAIGAFSLWCLVGSVVVRDYFLAEEDFRVARFEALKVGQTPVAYQRPRLILLDQLDAMSAATRSIPKPDMASDDIDLLRKAALRSPWPAIQNRYALSLALNGNAPEAQRQLKVMRAMHGEKMYASIRGQWGEWAKDTYPQLRDLLPPL